MDSLTTIIVSSQEARLTRKQKTGEYPTYCSPLLASQNLSACEYSKGGHGK